MINSDSHRKLINVISLTKVILDAVRRVENPKYSYFGSRYVLEFLNSLVDFKEYLDHICEQLSKYKVQADTNNQSIESYLKMLAEPAYATAMQEAINKQFSILATAPYLSSLRKTVAWSNLNSQMQERFISDITADLRSCFPRNVQSVTLYTTQDPDEDNDEEIITVRSLFQILPKVKQGTPIWELHCDPSRGLVTNDGSYEISRHCVSSVRRYL